MAELTPRNHFPIQLAPVKDGEQRVDHGCLHPRRLTGALALRLQVLSPLHVGTGAYEMVDTRLVRATLTRAERPIVPGSTLKGACRPVYEALTDSDSPFQEYQLKSHSGLSLAAAVFGSFGYRGRVGFDDAEPAEPVALVEIALSQTYPPRVASGRRFYGELPPGARQRRLIPTRAIPAGTVFGTCLRVRNVTEREIGGVLLSLGVGSFVLRLGGGKYDGYGCVRVTLEKYAFRSSDVWQRPRWIDDAAAVLDFQCRCLAAFEPTAAGKRALTLLRAKLVEPSSASAGTGVRL